MAQETSKEQTQIKKRHQITEHQGLGLTAEKAKLHGFITNVATSWHEHHYEVTRQSLPPSLRARCFYERGNPDEVKNYGIAHLHILRH
jgi:hypothetical protein